MSAPPEHSDPRHAGGEAPAPSSPQTPPPTCPPFEPDTFDRRLALDSAINWGILILVLVTITVSNLLPEAIALAGNLVVMVVIVVWMLLSFGSARVAQQLPLIGQLTEHDPAAAEARIAQAMRRTPLPRSVRLMLYAHLAGIRHRQDRFAETIAIAAAVLERTGRSFFAGRLGGRIVNAHVRAQLLLLMIEGQLGLHDLAGAYAAIMQLHQSRRTLVQTLQLTALQTQYEIAAGYDRHALQSVRDKIAMAELMPAPQCGAMHAMLARAARRDRQHQLADWLDRRARLICTPEQLEQFATRLAGVSQAQPGSDTVG